MNLFRVTHQGTPRYGVAESLAEAQSHGVRLVEGDVFAGPPFQAGFRHLGVLGFSVP